MSKETVAQLITKASRDDDFRMQLLYMPDEAFKGFQLTDAEKEALRKRNAKALGLDPKLGAVADRVLDTSGP